MLDKSRRHFRRYKEIARVLAKHGWGWMISRFGFPEYLHKHSGVLPKEHVPVHLREMLEELGPTFIKLGQLLSTRPDVVPEAYLSELAKLQDTAPTLPFAEIRKVLESEFDVPVSVLFSKFYEIPVAAASLAQVHRAELHDGTPVIVKVQRPNIGELIETDIEIIYKRAQFVEQHSKRLTHWDCSILWMSSRPLSARNWTTPVREEIPTASGRLCREENGTSGCRPSTGTSPPAGFSLSKKCRAPRSPISP